MIKYIRSDNGTEFVYTKFKEFCSQYGIQHQLTILYNPNKTEKQDVSMEL